MNEFKKILMQENIFNFSKEELINIYCCGPTSYNSMHIGNMRTMYFFFCLKLLLQNMNYNVSYIVNVTDIDDKIINKSLEKKELFQVISDKYFNICLQQMKQFRVIDSTTQIVRVTDEISSIIKYLTFLIENQYAYIKKDGIYCSIKKKYYFVFKKPFSTLENNEIDFCLWKFNENKNNEPKWFSPWGFGRPGWHLECVAIILRYFNVLHIHGGGSDLIFPHHENERYLFYLLTKNDNFVRHWLHVGMLKGVLDDKFIKMSKSKENDFFIFGNEIKLMFLNNSFRLDMNCNQIIIEQNRRKLKKIQYYMEKNVDVINELNAVKILVKLIISLKWPAAIGKIFSFLYQKKINFELCRGILSNIFDIYF